MDHSLYCVQRFSDPAFEQTMDLQGPNGILRRMGFSAPSKGDNQWTMTEHDALSMPLDLRQLFLQPPLGSLEILKNQLTNNSKCLEKCFFNNKTDAPLVRFEMRSHQIMAVVCINGFNLQSLDQSLYACNTLKRLLFKKTPMSWVRYQSTHEATSGCCLHLNEWMEKTESTLKSRRQAEEEKKRLKRISDAFKRIQKCLAKNLEPDAEDCEILENAEWNDFVSSMEDIHHQESMARRNRYSGPHGTEEGFLDKSLVKLFIQMCVTCGRGMREVGRLYDQHNKTKTVKVECFIKTYFANSRILVTTQPHSDGQKHWTFCFHDPGVPWNYSSELKEVVKHRLTVVREYKNARVRSLATLRIALNALWKHKLEHDNVPIEVLRDHARSALIEASEWQPVDDEEHVTVNEEDDESEEDFSSDDDHDEYHSSSEDSFESDSEEGEESDDSDSDDEPPPPATRKRVRMVTTESDSDDD